MKSVLLSRFSILLAAVVFISVGCKKLTNTTNTTVTTVTPTGENPTPSEAGKGGFAALVLTPDHDSVNIDSSMVYIKYNASVIPANNNYDDSVVTRIVGGKVIAGFYDLKPGKYYVFADGWDLVRSTRVRGGLPFIIDEKNKGTTFEFILPVYPYETGK